MQTDSGEGRRAVPFLRVAGPSMLPALRPGDVVEVAPPPPRLRIGDIAVFAVRDHLVIHRVVSRSPARQMGDNSHHGTPFDVRDVVGRAVTLHRDGDVVALNTWPRRLEGRLLAARGLYRIVRRQLVQRVAALQRGVA